MKMMMMRMGINKMNEKTDFENTNDQPLLPISYGCDCIIGYKGKFNIRRWDLINKKINRYRDIFDKVIKDNDELRKLYDEAYGLQLLNELKYTHEVVHDSIDEEYRIQDMVKDFNSKYDDDVKSMFIDAVLKNRTGGDSIWCKGIVLNEDAEEYIRVILKELIGELQAD